MWCVMQFFSDDLIIHIRSGRTDETEEKRSERKIAWLGYVTANLKVFSGSRFFSLFLKFANTSISIDCLSAHLLLCQLWLRVTLLYLSMNSTLFFFNMSLLACELFNLITIAPYSSRLCVFQHAFRVPIYIYSVNFVVFYNYMNILIHPITMKVLLYYIHILCVL